MNPPKPSLVEIADDAPIQSNLPDRLYAELKRRILTGAIAPNEHLREKKLCENLKVSRTPLREALNRLGNEDLVIFRPHCGYQAAALTSEDYRRLQEVRRIVESKVAALAAVRATEIEIEALRKAATMPEIVPGEDASFIRFCRANSRFHLLLVRTVRNPLLENIVMSALDQYQRPAYLGIGRVTDSGKASRCHLDIVDALSERDVFKAESAMANHVIGGSERIIRALVEAGL
ncbi:MAG: GntR family transcriptional regulator [Opitutaceae bacterium]